MKHVHIDSRFTVIILCATLCFTISAPSKGQDTRQTKEQLADQLYEVHGIGKMPFEAYRQWKASSSQYQQMAEKFPQITADDWGTLFKRLYEVDTPIMKKLFTSFMADRFEAAELSQISTFYGSTAGKKLLASIPEIFAQSAQARNDNDTRPVVHDWVTQMTKKYNLR